MWILLVYWCLLFLRLVFLIVFILIRHFKRLGFNCMRVCWIWLMFSALSVGLLLVFRNLRVTILAIIMWIWPTTILKVSMSNYWCPILFIFVSLMILCDCNLILSTCIVGVLLSLNKYWLLNVRRYLILCRCKTRVIVVYYWAQLRLGSDRADILAKLMGLDLHITTWLLVVLNWVRWLLCLILLFFFIIIKLIHLIHIPFIFLLILKLLIPATLLIVFRFTSG